ncbi:MAG: hypothetical protein PVG65_04205 [Candidatus Thorarchaeota archaeon]|jgi:hypothetical protein
MKKLLDIKTKGKLILFRGKPVRTPVKMEITDDEFKFLEVQLRRKCITDYTYGALPAKDGKPSLWNWGDEKVRVEGEEDLDEPKVEKIKVEEGKPKTILERLANK